MENCHSLPYEDVFIKLRSKAAGLDQQEAERRLKQFGPNRLQHKPPENIFLILFHQLNNPLIYILLASSILALFLGKATDAIVVLSVVVLNTLIGFMQEYRSSRMIQSLLEMIPQKSTVLRNSTLSLIFSSEIVVGDIVFLQAGDRVAADIRLFFIKNLQCDESALTGESLPIAKRIESVALDTSLGDRKCMAYSGTLVTSGTALGIVVATGIETEFGKISKLLEQVSSLETPLTQTLKKIAKWVTSAVFLIGAGVFGVGYFRGYSMLDAGLAAIALAVAAIPEGLPAAITIAAAIGVQRMAKRKAVIRHMLAVETLGSTTVICTDKTGTLTQNEMTVQSIWTPKGSYFVTGIGYSLEGQIYPKEAHIEEILTAAYLCNDATLEKREERLVSNGDPTEIALLIVGMKGGIGNIKELWPRIDVIPFESEKRIMATLHNSPLNKKVIFLKGAPEEVLKVCSIEELQIENEVENMARQGMRVIAFAKKDFSLERNSLEEADLINHYSFLGLIGMIDPPRPEALLAIQACQTAGITVKMITGDHPITASVIGSELGLGKSVVTGKDLEQLDQENLQKVIEHNHLFARVLPEQKLKIVEVLQAKDQIVAMTGDGVNDAPALKRANIGVSMGITGTAVAKEAADMILADDNFASIESAVEEGRRVYDNLIKSIAFMFPTNLSQALVILLAIVFFPIKNNVLLLPIMPVQILWVNLIVCVALTLPLAFEAMEPDIMHRPPRKVNAPILSTFVWIRTFLVAALMTTGTIGVFFWEYFNELAQGKSELIATSNAQTIAVTTLVFFQIFYLFNCRSLRFSIFRIGFFTNLYVLFGIGFVVLTQIAFVYLPFMNELFHTSFLEFKAWVISISVAFLIVPVVAFEKWLIKKVTTAFRKQ